MKGFGFGAFGGVGFVERIIAARWDAEVYLEKKSEDCESAPLEQPIY